jgi:hypothetical protein
VVAATEGGTASFTRELVRRGVLRALDTAPEGALPHDVAAGVTMSVGVVRAPMDGAPSEALAAADAAMYAAEHAGGNTVVSGTTQATGEPATPPTTPIDRTPLCRIHAARAGSCVPRG